MWCVTGLDWPAGEDHDSLPPSPWSSCWLPLAHEWVVSSLAEESPQSPAGVVGSASYPPAAAGPVNRVFDHYTILPVSLYCSQKCDNLYSLFPGDVESPAPVLLTFLLLVKPSSSLSQHVLVHCIVAEFVTLQYPPHTPFPIPSLDWGRGAVMSVVHLYHCQCVHLSP